MAIFQLKTFADIVAAVREELGVQATDTVAVDRIKRDINSAYLNEVVPAERWNWLRKQLDVSTRPSFTTGSASVTKNSVTVTLSEIPTVSYKGYWFSKKGSIVRHRILAHTANTSILTLETPYTDNTSTTSNFLIWSDEVPLPTDCAEIIEVTHDYQTVPVENRGLQEFRRVSTTRPQQEAKPQYYSTTGWLDPEPFDSVSLPASASRSSDGRLKTITFAATVSSVSTGQFIRVSGASDSSYNTDDAIVASVSGNDIKYIGSGDAFESSVADTGITVEVRNQEIFGERYRNLLVWPAVDSVVNVLHLDYISEARPLENDSDEPLIPYSDRIVLKYAGLASSWVKQRNPEMADRNAGLFARKLQMMQGDTEDSIDKPQIKPSREYIGRKRAQGRGFKNPVYGSFGFGPVGTGGSTTPTGTADRAAVFGSDGRLQSSNITTTEIEALDNVSSNIQAQIDALNAANTFLDDALSLTTQTLSDNSSGTIVTFPTATYDTIVLFYSVLRGTARETGHITLATDGSSAAIAQGAIASLGTSGVTLSADVSGANLRLNFSTTSTGSDATFKYKGHRWLSS